MYKVLIVDDEASASNYIKQIIDKKCLEYSVCGIAEDGLQALKMVQENRPDLIISDIRMPVMDGILLSEAVSKNDPDILLVLVSGYQEFEYAQKALRAGVSEYLLKPVKPRALQNLLTKLVTNLNHYYYEKRIEMFNRIVMKDEHVSNQEIESVFASGRYYALLMRKKGLPKRFLTDSGVPIYSLANEQFFIYGRDEMEAFYLIHEKYLFHENISEFTFHIMERFQEVGDYITCIKYPKSFSILELPTILKLLHRNLDWGIVIGENQIIEADRNCEYYSQIGEEEKEIFERIEYFIRYKDINKLEKILDCHFNLWHKEKRNQMYLEKQINHIFYLLNKVYEIKEYQEIIYALDEAFSYVESLNELKEIVIQLIRQFAPEDKREVFDDKEELFNNIVHFLKNHLNEEITLVKICKKFGVSQTSLNRMFHNQKQTSFGNYLVQLRIEHAKEILQREPGLYIKDVAERVGYKDQFYFSRLFRSIVGISPSEFIN
ncbi:response regulator transcription factor [Robinsoniella peoriensis]|uniref:response regulator transcription factor n=1 Tax=Robinsoniella peoriensis TaxID=180332 RepID=UPI00085C487E|nr:response regulator [Robinsoniella peoriensis]